MRKGWILSRTRMNAGDMMNKRLNSCRNIKSMGVTDLSNLVVNAPPKRHF